MTVAMLQTMVNALNEIDLSFITKMVIYRELAPYLHADDIETAITLIYMKWIDNEIWVDLMTFSKHVGQQWDEYKDKYELISDLIDHQEDLE